MKIRVPVYLIVPRKGGMTLAQETPPSFDVWSLKQYRFFKAEVEVQDDREEPLAPHDTEPAPVTGLRELQPEELK